MLHICDFGVIINNHIERLVYIMSIGDRIKKRRQELDISVEELSKRLGKNRATIYRYENNDIENFPISILPPLAEALHVSEAWLMGYDVPMDSKITTDEAWDAEADKFNDEMSQFQLKEKAFLHQLKVLGWSCNHIDDRQDEENDESYYLLKKDETSFRISWEDYKKFINDSETFFTKRLRDLWKQSQFYLFSGLKAAHNDNAADPEQQKLMEADLQDMEDNW